MARRVPGRPAAMGEAAVKAAKAVGYYGAGTAQAYENMLAQDPILRKYQILAAELPPATVIPSPNRLQAAINNLPNRGLSGDGVHPSEAPDNKDAYFDAEHLQYGFNVLNLGRLQVLYELWRQVLYDGGTVSNTNPPPPPAEPTDPPVPARPAIEPPPAARDRRARP